MVAQDCFSASFHGICSPPYMLFLMFPGQTHFSLIYPPLSLPYVVACYAVAKGKSDLSLWGCVCVCVGFYSVWHATQVWLCDCKEFPPILPPSQSGGSPPSLTHQGSFLSVLCRLAMCCSYLFHFIILVLQNVTQRVFHIICRRPLFSWGDKAITNFPFLSVHFGGGEEKIWFL